jgi:hypothetical protein
VGFDQAIDFDQMVIVLKAEGESIAAKAKAAVVNMAASGMDEQAIIKALMNDLSSGGPIFGTLASQYVAAAGSFVDSLAQGAIFASQPSDTRWTWITTSSGPCHDCLDRHNETKSYDEWEELGLPGAGATECGFHCLCVLVPESAVDKPAFGGAIEVPPIDEARQKFMRSLDEDEGMKARVMAARAQYRFRNDPEKLKRYNEDAAFREEINADITKRSNAALKAVLNKRLDKADTARQVEGAARKAFPGKTFGFSGIDPAIAREAVREFGDVGFTYPGSLKDVVSLTSGDSAVWNRHNGALGLFNPKTGEIMLNPEECKDLAAYLDYRNLSIKGKFHPEGTETASATPTHELGHALALRLKLRDDEAFIALIKSFRKRGAIWVEENLSDYANENFDEFVAEAWLEFRCSPAPREVATAVGEAILKRLEAL